MMNYGKKTRKMAVGGAVREGRNENIDDDVRARALAYVQRGGESEEAKPQTAPARRARAERATDTGDESDRLSRRYAKTESLGSMEVENDPSVPSLDAGKNVREQTKASSLKSGLMDTAGKVLGAVGATGGAIAAGRAIGKRIAGKQAEGVMSAGGKRAAETRRKMAESRAAKESAAKEADDVRFADEGNPNYARGGLIGHGDFNYGKKKGK